MISQNSHTEDNFMKTILIMTVIAILCMFYSQSDIHYAVDDVTETDGFVPSGKYDTNSYSKLDNPKLFFNASQNDRSTVVITWKYTKNVMSTCNKESKLRGGTQVFNPTTIACSFWDGNECTIITNKKTTTHSLGHEVRHCFQGEWH